MTLLGIILFNFAFGMSRKPPVELPEKPSVTFCFVQAGKNLLACTKDKEHFTIPLIETDNYVCFNPDDWQVIANYNIELRRIAHRCER